jgi:alpha-beta hydrolase superfamily lysophospholipase
MTEAAADGDGPLIETADGHRIRLTLWQPSATPAAVVQVLHGLSEHLGRYHRFAEACRARGFAVIGHNHRGHGPHCAPDSLGHFADRDGWDKVIADALEVQRFARRGWPDRPLVLFGHSMGSYIAQCAVAHEPAAFSALALSGSTWSDRKQVRAGRWLARLVMLISGGRHASPLLHKLGLEGFNTRFAPTRTEVDWLTRDEVEVDRNVADPLCGFPLSNRMWHDLLGGLLEVTSMRTLRRIPADLPILITGGEEDPVGGRRGMTRLAEAYARTGHRKVTLEVWPRGRHEMLNEVEREAFTAFVLEWIAAAAHRESRIP